MSKSELKGRKGQFRRKTLYYVPHVSECVVTVRQTNKERLKLKKILRVTMTSKWRHAFLSVDGHERIIINNYN